MKADDILADVVGRLVAQMEAGALTWKMPWNSGAMYPTNAMTGLPYNGGNVMMLWVHQFDRAYERPLWATYKQWQQMGAQVRKGEKSVHLIKWLINERENPAGEKVKRFIPRGFSVFNAAQVDGYEPPVFEPKVMPDHLQHVLDTIGVDFWIGKPCYMPAMDRVMMPPVHSFDSIEHYFGTAMHELAHWTGHKSRLDRDLTGRFGSDSYAMEELIAELSAALSCASYGVASVERLDHAAYLQSWCRVLKADPKVLWSAASAAQKATNYLESLASGSSVDGEMADAEFVAA